MTDATSSTDPVSTALPVTRCPECDSRMCGIAIGEFEDWTECRECGHRFSFVRRPINWKALKPALWWCVNSLLWAMAGYIFGRLA